MNQEALAVHKSKLGGFIIDCRTDNLEAAADFWGHALGAPPKRRTREADNAYLELSLSSSGLYAEVQQVEHASRVHLDIETDDMAAEITRLEKLGARRVADIRDWCVLEAPTGQRFCVVPVESADFEQTANEWS